MAGTPGVPSGFEEFYRRDHRRILLFVRKARGAEWGDAWDAVQAGFVKALERWDRIKDPSTWIRTTVLREFDAQRRRPREDFQRALRAQSGEQPDFTAQWDLKEETRQVYDCLTRLPRRQAEVMAWTFDGYKPGEIARILSEANPDAPTNPAAVRASLALARRRLRESLLDEGGTT
ncbi:hypothetical protein B4N89_47295 [Embleya scabrispora]|uniref:Uncharacterized protein n=1 Tax=Embleya scabrispora TaxID=159449 RepID=A0A1T3NI18_9ACTN|nr:sigma-70 family RNA polymerase sigma factor [Embleya scabrispora]OPC76418.1 hypothetical protein B4N89_47295 [Embleya scabrispora]